MTEQRAKEIVDEITVALDVQERFVRVEDQPPFGSHLTPALDQKTKHQFFRLKRTWLESVDEGEFRFAVAYHTVLLENMFNRTQSLTYKLLTFIAAAPAFALVLFGGQVDAALRLCFWGAWLLLMMVITFLLLRLNLREMHLQPYVRALGATRDYESAQRYLLDDAKWEGTAKLMRPKHKLLVNQLARLKNAADQLGLIPSDG